MEKSAFHCTDIFLTLKKTPIVLENVKVFASSAVYVKSSLFWSFYSNQVKCWDILATIKPTKNFICCDFEITGLFKTKSPWFHLQMIKNGLESLRSIFDLNKAACTGGSFTSNITLVSGFGILCKAIPLPVITWKQVIISNEKSFSWYRLALRYKFSIVFITYNLWNNWFSFVYTPWNYLIIWISMCKFHVDTYFLHSLA